ncbi:MAG: sigma-70 family RNA polymerase sigma factor [Vicingaceae bacterium]
MKDQEVLDAIATKRESRAIHFLYQSVFPQVLATVQKYGGMKHDAEDVFQEALVVLIRKVEAGHFQLQAKLSTYLCAICKYNWWEKNKGLNRVELMEGHRLTPAEVELLEKSIHEEAKYQKAELAFDRLGEKCKKLLQYFYLEDKSMRWIATKLSLKSGKVAKNQKYKCMKKARWHYHKLAEA